MKYTATILPSLHWMTYVFKKVWDSSWPIPNPKRWCYESATLNMAANLENSAVATGLEKVSFQSDPKEGQRQRMFKVSYNCVDFMC